MPPNKITTESITFFVTESSHEAASVGPLKEQHAFNYKGSVQLLCHFNRVDLWEAVLRRLNGLEMHKGSDIQSELLCILQGKVELLENELEQHGKADRERAQRAEQAASLANADKVRAEQYASLLKAQLDIKSAELEDLRGTVRMWENWYKQNCSLPAQ